MSSIMTTWSISSRLARFSSGANFASGWPFDQCVIAASAWPLKLCHTHGRDHLDFIVGASWRLRSNTLFLMQISQTGLWLRPRGLQVKPLTAEERLTWRQTNQLWQALQAVTRLHYLN